MSNKIRFAVQNVINTFGINAINGIAGTFMPIISSDSPTSKTEAFPF